MSNQELGIYFKLLCFSWMDDASLADDHEELALLVREPLEIFQHAWRRVGACFKSSEGVLRNPRLEEIRSGLSSYRDAQSENGKRGAATRWAKPKNGDPNGDHNGESMATLSKNDGDPNSESMATPSENGDPISNHNGDPNGDPNGNPNGDPNSESMATPSKNGDPNGESMATPSENDGDAMISPMARNSSPSPSPSPKLRSVSSLRSDTAEPDEKTADEKTADEVAKKARPQWEPSRPPSTLSVAIPAAPDALREYARWFMIEYGNVSDPAKQDKGMFEWVNALDALRTKGANTLTASRTFARARLNGGGRPLFGSMVKSVPPMFARTDTPKNVAGAYLGDPRGVTVPEDRQRSPRASLGLK